MKPTQGSSGDGAVALVTEHAADLHRTAVMLTGDDARAQALMTRLAHGARRSRASSVDALHGALARSFARTARRRDDPAGLGGRGGGPAAVLAGLRPLARAATVLRRGLGWDAAATGTALGISASRVDRLVPGDAAMSDALQALADQHPPPADYQDLVRSAATRAAPTRWGRIAVAAGAALALGGYGLSHLATDSAADEVAPDEIAIDYNERGWVITDDAPPTSVDGMQLFDFALLDFGGPQEFDVARYRGDLNLWAVLWCEIPPLDDPRLNAPVAQVEMSDHKLEIPCAGKDGIPQVRQLTYLPPPTPDPGPVRLAWTGATPSRGQALFAVYAEATGPPAPMDAQVEPPAPPAGSVVLDDSSPKRWVAAYHGQPSIRVEIGADSTITIWAGGPGLVAVEVDGVGVTDDGDGDSESAVVRYAVSDGPLWTGLGGPVQPTPEPAEAWTRQDPELRNGFWRNDQPTAMRTFDLPEGVRPTDGERVVVTVDVTPSMDDQPWWVAISDADPQPAPQALVPVPLDPRFPEWVNGLRPAASWEVPFDGQEHELVLPQESASFPLVFQVLRTENRADDEFLTGVLSTTYADGVQVHDGVWVGDEPRDPERFYVGWTSSSLTFGDTVSLTLPPGSADAPALVIAYQSVGFEEFDHRDAPLPFEAWDDEPWLQQVAAAAVVVDSASPSLVGARVVTLNGEVEGRVMLRLTTKGAGYIEVSSDGFAVPVGGGTLGLEGWWSPWTDRELTAYLDLDQTSLPLERTYDVRVHGFYERVEMDLISVPFD